MESNPIIEPLDDEDLSEIIVKLEKSFQLKFANDAFYKVETYGDILDVFQSHIQYTHDESCTKMQAFFRIRAAIAKTLSIDTGTIGLETYLKTLFPYKDRRKNTWKFCQHLGIKVNMLTAPDWLSITLLLGILISMIGLFFNWQIALCSIVILSFALHLAYRYGKNMEVQTMRQLTEKIVTEHYIAIRRNPRTVNRNEIWDIIQSALGDGLGTEKDQIQPGTRLHTSKNASTQEV